MLRVKNRCLGQARKVFIRAASLGLLAITSAAGLVRGAAAADEQPAKEQPVAEAARLEKPNDGSGSHGARPSSHLPASRSTRH